MPHRNAGLGCVFPVGTIPLRLRRSPVFKRRTKHDSLPEPEGEPGPSSDAAGEPRRSPPLRSPPQLLKRARGYSSSPQAHTSTPDLSRCHAAGLAPCRSGPRRRALASPGTNCCKCTRLSSRRPKRPGARRRGASPGTLTPLHVPNKTLQATTPCRGDRQLGRPAQSRGTGLLRPRLAPMTASPTFCCGDKRGTSIAQEGRDVQGLCRSPRDAPSPNGLCRHGQLMRFGQELGRQPRSASVTRALSPLQLLTPGVPLSPAHPRQQDHNPLHFSTPLRCRSPASPPHRSPNDTGDTQRLPPVLPSALDQARSSHGCLRQSSKMLIFCLVFPFFLNIRAVYLKNIQFLFLISTA